MNVSRETSIQMAKIDPNIKERLKEKAAKKGKTMTDLVKQQLRELYKQNGIPTI